MSKSILITGASSGIGEALAAEFARRGYRLALLARRVETLEQMRKGLLEAGAPAVFVGALDLRQTTHIATAIEACVAALGGLDIVVANAGIGYVQRVGEGDFMQVVETIEVDLTGACATIDAAIRHFRQRGRGQVVAITSVARYRSMPGLGIYSACKEGLHRYMQGLRAETRNESLVITELAPGYIDTPMNRGSKSRPFVIPVEQGAMQMAELIEAEVAYSTVPRWPWTVLAQVLRIIPLRFLGR